ncbi:MAG: hypothetical protein ABW224_05760 [Kibdelosporangium sp.]
MTTSEVPVPRRKRGTRTRRFTWGVLIGLVIAVAARSARPREKWIQR